MTAKERQNYLAVRAWVYFTFNFSDVEGIIEFMCERAGRKDLKGHLLEKICGCYETYGSRSCMPMFYCELSPNLQNVLTEYVIEKYAPQGLKLSDEDKEILGI